METKDELLNTAIKIISELCKDAKRHDLQYRSKAFGQALQFLREVEINKDSNVG